MVTRTIRSPQTPMKRPVPCLIPEVIGHSQEALVARKPVHVARMGHHLRLSGNAVSVEQCISLERSGILSEGLFDIIIDSKIHHVEAGYGGGYERGKFDQLLS